MAGIAIANTAAHRVKAPVHVFVDTANPAAGSNLTLAATAAGDWKTPDATESPNGLYVGCLNNLKMGGSAELTRIYCDNLNTALDTLVGQQQFNLELEILNIFNPTLMAKLFGLTNTTVSTKTKLLGGHVENFPTFAVTLVGRTHGDPTTYWYAHFYNVKQVKLWTPNNFKINDFAKVALMFECMSLSGRTPGQDVFEVVQGI